MTQLTELFQYDVKREIPPVVYFHETSPEKLHAEVSEYVITGGWPPESAGHKRVQHGIHEHYVGLLKAIRRQLDAPGGPSLPASWISGFYGSGKSSFAKLLGLALDGKRLPNDQPLAEAWLERNHSPLAHEMRDAWEALLDKVDPLAVVFDIGGVARGDEHVHTAVVRQLQQRLKYCRHSSYVADHEIKLERNGDYETFEAKCKETLGKPWEELRDDHLVEDKFSAVMYAQFPELYGDPMDWLAARDGMRPDALSAEDAAEAIDHMLDRRAHGKTLFVVVDEVSQYIFQDEGRMLKLQSLVEALGSRLKGKAWLLATGQQKLDDQNDANVLGKMKARFPESLRVHLDASNIRDVVHRRLLQKKPDKRAELAELFERYRSNLQLFAYGADGLGVDDFVDVYPMLPKHFDLVLRVTSALRTRSNRTQGDDHNIRGLLQMLGELFRTQGLAEKPLGSLVTLDQVYEIQKTALDVDMANTMIRLLQHCAEKELPLAARCAKAVALLQLLTSEDGGECVDSKLVAQSIYADVKDGDNEPAVREALQRLYDDKLLGYSEETGYKLQSSAEQDWVRERDEIVVPYEERGELIREALVTLLGDVEKPKHRGIGFSWQALFSTDQSHTEELIYGRREDSPIVADFRVVPESEQDKAMWINRSAETAMKTRLVWIAGEYKGLMDQAREVGRCRRMKHRYEVKRGTLRTDQRRLLADEEARLERLQDEFSRQVGEAFMAGAIYINGEDIDPSVYGAAFRPSLVAAGTAKLPHIYPEFVPNRVVASELEHLLANDLQGAPQIFFGDNLGILESDAGRIVPRNNGAVPRAIRKEIEHKQGLSGQGLLRLFAAPPFGLDANVVKACVAGLLRERVVRIKLQKGGEVTTIGEPGVSDLFKKDREFKNAEIYPAGEPRFSTRDRARIAKLFKEVFSQPIDPESEVIADRIGDAIKDARRKLTEVERRLNRLPDRPETPELLDKLGKAFEACTRDRQVEARVRATLKHLDVLRDGMGRLNAYHAEMTDDAIDAVSTANRVWTTQLQQLYEVGELTPALQAHEKRIAAQLKREDPWVDINTLDPDIDAVLAAYAEARQKRMAHQEELAEWARAKVKGDDGFVSLDDERRALVLRPIQRAVIETTPTKDDPPLRVLEAGMKQRFEEAKEAALRELEALRTETTGEVTVRVQLEVNDRVIRSAADVDALLDEIRQRLMEALDSEGKSVRLRLK